MNEIVTISELGAQADGIGYGQIDEQNALYIPFTLPGEKVAVSGSGAHRQLVSVLDPSPERVSPVCEHFGECGGCQLQHMQAQSYQRWKQNLLLSALERENITTDILPMLTFDGHKRRRATFTLMNDGDGLKLGFSEKSTHRLVNIHECPVLVPEISGKLAELRALAGRAMMGKTGLRIEVLATDAGMDINLAADHAIDEVARKNLVGQAITLNLARLSVNGETIVERLRPEISLATSGGSYRLTPPPGGFLQAVEGAQNAMIALVTRHLKSCKEVADLFCGAGTFTLPLAEKSMVSAYEFDAASLAALTKAWRDSGGRLKKIIAEKRDLLRSPVTFQELKKFDGAVFDPPRAGAEAQARQFIKAAKLKRIAAISCNPVTLARDLKILNEGGFRIKSITPIDQFQYTPHLEVVALLER